jgi:hypothetical protein
MRGLINDWVQHHARVSPTKTATVELASGRRHSYAEMHDRKSPEIPPARDVV